MKPNVKFSAELLAIGDATSIDLHEFNYENTAVLVFVAPIEEVRKAGVLFRQTATLHAGPVADASEDLVLDLVLAAEQLMLSLERGEKPRVDRLLAAIAKARGP